MPSVPTLPAIAPVTQEFLEWVSVAGLHELDQGIFRQKQLPPAVFSLTAAVGVVATIFPRYAPSSPG